MSTSRQLWTFALTCFLVLTGCGETETGPASSYDVASVGVDESIHELVKAEYPDAQWVSGIELRVADSSPESIVVRWSWKRDGDPEFVPLPFEGSRAFMRTSNGKVGFGHEPKSNAAGTRTYDPSNWQGKVGLERLFLGLCIADTTEGLVLLPTSRRSTASEVYTPSVGSVLIQADWRLDDLTTNPSDEHWTIPKQGTSNQWPVAWTGELGVKDESTILLRIEASAD